MGNCLELCLGRSKGGGPKGSVQMRQQNAWQSTGIIGLRDQNLKELPSSLEGLGSVVKVVDASNNKLSALPAYLGTFDMMNRLLLTNNVISALPATVGSLLNLKVLMLDLNRLEDLPDEIGQLRKLEKLSVYSNALVRLPRSVSGLVALSSLCLSHNKLAYLPEELGSCAALEELEAANNTISEIPSSLAHLKRLKTLNLDNNRLERVPSAILTGCVALQTLSLHGNPITPDTLAATPGHAEFEARRRAKYDKLIAGGAVLPSKGLDEGVDRQLEART